MSLTFKKSTPKNYNNLDILIEDTTPLSNNYFRVSDVPSILCKGKNLLRISAHPSHFLPDSQIIVDIKDANGEPIYFEIPEYLEGDKSRIISIWIYHDKDDYNTANGEAVISLYGIAKRDVRPGRNNAIPAKYEGKYNLKWSTTVNVDRNRNNISPVIFNSTLLPTTTLSESIDVYKNSPTDGTELEFTPITGNGANYLFRGKTPIIKTTDGQFLPEMVGNNIFLDTFVEPALPISKYDNPLNITSYTSSIKSIIDTNTVILDTPFTTTFTDRDELIHTFNQIDSANYSVSYFQEESRTNTENQRSFANVTFSGLEPITGVVDKIKVLIKSDGLPGEFELLNEVTVPFSSSVAIKVPIPSEHLNDPKILKFQYLNSIGEISRTQTKLRPFTFEGGNSYIGGDKNLISGSMFISNALGTGIQMGGLSSGFIRSVGFDGQTSASLGKGPGGFIIYSGSGNMLIGEDVLHGVGMQMIGDNDDRHFIFTTDGGGLLDVKTDKFFIGTTASQFISGSDSNIEISSSLFHLDPKNNSLVIGAGTVINAALSANEIFTPATIGGVQSTRLNASASIDSGGFARFVSASIGGFEVSTTQINSANNNLILKSNGQITASSANINGDIVTDNITATGGTIGGFELTSTQINSTNDNLILKSNGQITASSANINGDIVTDNITATGGTIGGFSINTATISSSNNNLILKDSGQITGSTVLFSGGTIGGFSINTATISSSNNNLILKDSGQITGSNVLFSGGTIAGFEVASTQINSVNDNLILKSSGQITASNGFLFGDKGDSQYVQYTTADGLVVRGDLSVDQIFTPATIAGSPANITNASSSITSTGFAKFTSASIGGWDITTASIEGGNLLMKPEGILQTKDFASGLKGWKISSEGNGTAEFENVRIRGTMRTTTFEKESVNAVGGQLWIANSTTLTGSFTSSAATMSVKNVKGFVSGEILLAKKVDNTGFQTEYILVNSSSLEGDQSNEDENYGRLYVTRGYGSGSTGDYVGDVASISQSYEDGQVVVSTGKVGTGYIKLNANPSDTATPFMDIVERTGSGLYDVALAARLGDLSGLANSDYVFGSSAPGYGLATNNVYLQGGIKATFGTIGGFGINATTVSSSNGLLILSSSGHITAESGKIASFLITSSRFDALRTVEEFEPINGLTASLSSITGEVIAVIPSEVDSRATISINGLPTSSIVGILSRERDDVLHLRTGSYALNGTYQINYSGSDTFNGGNATFVSESFTRIFPSASYGAITGGYYSQFDSYQDHPNYMAHAQPSDILNSYRGLYAFIFNAGAINAGTDLYTTYNSDTSSNNPFNPTNFSTPIDDRVNFNSNINEDLELYVKPDLELLQTFKTGSFISTRVSASGDLGASSAGVDGTQGNINDETNPGQFTFISNLTNPEVGTSAGYSDGFGSMINTTQPHIDFINQFWTGSDGGTDTFIWVASATQTISETGEVTHTFFLSSSMSDNGVDYSRDFFAPKTSGEAQTLTPAEYDILSGSMFCFMSELTSSLGFDREQTYKEFTTAGEIFNLLLSEGMVITASIAPVLTIINEPVQEFPYIYADGNNTTPTFNINYLKGAAYLAPLAPGYFLNPAAAAILNTFSNNTETSKLGSSNFNGVSWTEMLINDVDSGHGPQQYSYGNNAVEAGIGPLTADASTPLGGLPLKFYHNSAVKKNTVSSEVKLYNSIWPLEIAESGSFQPTSGSDTNNLFSDSVISAVGRAVNITSRIDATRVLTDLTAAEYADLTGSGDVYQRGNLPTYGAESQSLGYAAEYEQLLTFNAGPSSRVSVGSLSGSFVEKVTFSISGSGIISSSNFILDDNGDITGSNVNFSGGVISGSALNINANKFEFSNPNGKILGNETEFSISSSLFDLSNKNLTVKGDIRASSGFMQDTYLGGKIVETGVINNNAVGVRYQLPFVEAWSKSPSDAKFSQGGGDASNTLIGSHGSWIIGGPIALQKQFLVTGSSHDGVGYPAEFKSWYDISGVGNDYKYVNSENVLDVAAASASLSNGSIGTQLIFNDITGSNVSQSINSTITSELINISQSLNLGGGVKNSHLQFGVRGTTHPYPMGFTGFNPTYQVDIISGSKTFFTKTYQDENATHKNWVVFDIPLTDILSIHATPTVSSSIEEVFKVKLSMRYSGSLGNVPETTLHPNVPDWNKPLGFALTEMRLVEPVRIASIDTQTIHFKDTYLTWDGKETTAHKGNFAPIVTSSIFNSATDPSGAPTASYTLGTPTQRWKTAYLKDAVSTLSDRRLKSNIEISDLGLSFIDSLKPVKYNMNDDTTHYGLIAQEVSQSLAEFDVHNFGGYDTDGNYLSLRYSEFISPLIKAVQEQSNIINKLQTRIETLESGSGN